MKPETRIALVKMAEKAKQIQTDEYSGRWIRYGYAGAAMTSLLGVYLMSSAIALISGGNNPLLGALYLLVTLLFTLMPWYFMIRYSLNRNIQLLCEAILSVNQDQSHVPAPPPVVERAPGDRQPGTGSKSAGRRRRRRSGRNR
ncbi:MAG TPA: hypothetical protein DEP53_19220 [Bacteroidetes bacterium]|nr:MAG: hypothetical protein A2X66_09855 [Ignavibacteria bacterium GWA2_54_16]HCA81868.1 hypothetical protein [Bacteroidota bacterium]